MVKFNPNKLKTFQDFLVLQNDLKAAQTSYENAKNMEVVTDTVFGMGLVAGAQTQKMYTRSRNRKLALVGMLLAGGVYLYNNKKKEASSSRTGRRHIDYSKPRAKQSGRRYINYNKLTEKHKYEEVKSDAK